MVKVTLSSNPDVEVVKARVEDILTMIEATRGADYDTFKRFNPEMDFEHFLSYQPVVRSSLKTLDDTIAFAVYAYLYVYLDMKASSDKMDTIEILDKCPEFKCKYLSLPEEYQEKLLKEFRGYPMTITLIQFKVIFTIFVLLLNKKNEERAADLETTDDCSKSKVGKVG